MSNSDKGRPWGQPDSNNDSDNVWSAAQDKKKQAAVEAADPMGAKVRRRSRRLVWIGGFFVLLLVGLGVLVVAAPTIASSFAPGMINSRAGDYITGEAKVDSVSLSWGGPQVITNLTLSEKGQEVLRASVEVEAGLLGLVRGSLNLGEVKLSDVRAKLLREADGTLNIQRLLASPNKVAGPAGGSSSGGSSPAADPKLPEGLQAKLVIDDLAAEFTDRTTSPSTTVSLTGVKASTAMVLGEPLTLDFRAGTHNGSLNTPAAAGSGNIKINITVDKWSKADGTVTIKRAKTDSKIEITDLPVSLLDAAMAMAGPSNRPALASGLGEKLTLKVDANGEMGDLTGTLSLQSDGVQADGGVAWKDKVITVSPPLTAKVTGRALEALVPDIRKSLDAQSAAKLDALPDLTLSVDSLRLPFASDGKPLNLQTASATISAGISQVTGQLKLNPEEAMKAFVLAPLNIKIESADIGQGLTVQGKSDLKIAGDPAGDILIDVTTGSLLDAKGALLAGMPQNVTGTVSVRNIATAIIQPFVASAGLDLATDLGPTLDLQVAAKSAASSGADIPPTELTLSAKARELDVAGQLVVRSAGLETVGEGVRVRLASAGRVASRFVKPETGWSVSAANGGAATIVIKDLAVPRNATTKAFDAHLAGVACTISLDGLQVRSLKTQGAPVDVQSVNIAVGVNAGDATLTLNSRLNHDGQAFAATGQVNAPKLLVAPVTKPDGTSSIMADPATLRPVGQLELSNVPTALASLLNSPPEEGKKAMDLGRVVSALAGPLMQVQVTSKPGTAAGAFDLTMNARADRLNAGMQAAVSKSALDFKGANVDSTLSQELITTMLTEVGTDLATLPRLVGEARLNIVVDPVSIPLDSASKPVWSQSGVAKATITANGKTTVEGLKLKNEDGTERDIGRVGIEGLSIVASAPLPAVMGIGAPSANSAIVAMTGRVIGPSNTALCDLRVNANAQIEKGQPAGPANVVASIKALDTQQLERIMGQDGLYSGALGDRVTLEVSVLMTPPSGAKGAFDPATGTIAIDSTIEAPNVQSSGPLSATISPDRIAITKPASFKVRVEPKMANSFLTTAPKPGQPAPDPATQLRMTEGTTLDLTIDSLTLPRKAGPKFDVKAGLQSPGVAMESGDGKQIRLGAITFRAATDGSKPSPPLTFGFEATSASVDEFKTSQPLKLQGIVENIIGADGALDIKKGMLSMGGDLKGIPTALIDALAKQQGMLGDALGPVVNVLITAERVPLEGLAGKNGPDLRFEATADRATAVVKGGVGSNVFTSSAPINISITEIVNALAKRYAGSVPIVKNLEKTKGQRAATITAQSLQVPLNNDMTKLNGTVVLDPGEINFELSEGLAKIVSEKVLKQKGVLGQKLKPFTAVITNGVAQLQRYQFPIGEFTLELEGDVDLVEQRVDMVTWIPATLLADEALGNIAGLMPGGNNPLVNAGDFTAAVRDLIPLIPYRTQGPLSSPSPSIIPDVNLLMQEFEKNGGWQKVLQRILKDKGGDIFKKLPGDLFKLPGSTPTPGTPPVGPQTPPVGPR